MVNGDFINHARELFTKGMNMKANMKRKGLKAAKAKCPFCDGGFWYARLVGPKDHFHMGCNKCDVRMME